MAMTDPDPLQVEVAALRRDLWATRDALIGAQAELATMRVRQQDLEVLIGQLHAQLDTEQRIVRWAARLRNHPLVRGAGRTLRDALGRGAG